MFCVTEIIDVLSQMMDAMDPMKKGLYLIIPHTFTPEGSLLDLEKFNLYPEDPQTNTTKIDYLKDSDTKSFNIIKMGMHLAMNMNLQHNSDTLWMVMEYFSLKHLSHQFNSQPCQNISATSAVDSTADNMQVLRKTEKESELF